VLSIAQLPLTLSATTLTVQLYAPAVGLKIKLKAEDANNPGVSVETDANTTGAGWQTLTFDMASQSPGTAALNPAATYNKLTIFPDFTCGGASPGIEEIFYVGPITFIGANGPSAPPL